MACLSPFCRTLFVPKQNVVLYILRLSLACHVQVKVQREIGQDDVKLRSDESQELIHCHLPFAYLTNFE